MACIRGPACITTSQTHGLYSRPVLVHPHYSQLLAKCNRVFRSMTIHKRLEIRQNLMDDAMDVLKSAVCKPPNPACIRGTACIQDPASIR